jgi:hypothetical protein
MNGSLQDLFQHLISLFPFPFVRDDVTVGKSTEISDWVPGDDLRRDILERGNELEGDPEF